jgi:hypothetical protein
LREKSARDKLRKKLANLKVEHLMLEKSVMVRFQFWSNKLG